MLSPVVLNKVCCFDGLYEGMGLSSDHRIYYVAIRVSKGVYYFNAFTLDPPTKIQGGSVPESEISIFVPRSHLSVISY